ncbi:hypothetical protein EIN_424840 [Entamoeba invadens IP1]|uniref:Uncharacterized protein n=1 Tax=Entamoeba invadens IP1 TaxID=370355 RepID=A0A0A1U5W1_ENTIV|nr:hypothetical protein EIN_424840 [Entamoeba invadens IP1]ELP89762.1 hypothetical protein EIN_424840 [Entamoeba invadens IP1]|eukprot:XP_004256533.1 hypothetical protein EIN_424840 [Entamoeba invadens IP1]
MSQTTNETMYTQLSIYNVLDRLSGGSWKLSNEQKKELQKIKNEKKPRTNIAQEIHSSEILVFNLINDKIDSLEEQIKDLKNQNETLQNEKEEVVKKNEEMQKDINRYIYMDELMDDLEKEHNAKILAEEKEYHAKEIRSRCDKNEKKIKMLQNLINQLRGPHSHSKEFK